MKIEDLFDMLDETERDTLFRFPQREETKLSFLSFLAARRRMHTILKQEPRERRKDMKQFIKKSVCAAVVAASLITGAFATVYHRLASESFADIFGTAHTEIIDTIGRPVHASATDHGVTITADAIIGDQYHYAITYRIAKDDGTPFVFDPATVTADGHLPLYFDDWKVRLAGSAARNEAGHCYFYDADPSDPAIQYVILYQVSQGNAAGSTVKTAFENLTMLDINGNETEVIPGKWNLSFHLDFADASVKLPAGQTFEQDGIHFTIDEISLSPIALHVGYTADRKVQPDSDTEQDGGYLESVRIFINKTDGTRLDLSQSSGSTKAQGDKIICTKDRVFEEILPLEDVSSITMNGIEIPLQSS